MSSRVMVSSSARRERRRMRASYDDPCSSPTLQRDLPAACSAWFRAVDLGLMMEAVDRSRSRISLGS
jgi:hypothetical protein